MVMVVRARTSASARARRASREPAATRSTSVLTVAPTATNTTNATKFWGPEMANVWRGGTKNQFDSKNAPNAAASPGANPPMVAVPITSTRNMSSTADKPTWVGKRTTPSVRPGSPRSTSIQALSTRRRDKALRLRRRTSIGGRIVSGPAMTWTSSGPARRSTSCTTDTRRRCSQRDRRLAPITTCVAFSVRANSTNAAPMSSPTTS